MYLDAANIIPNGKFVFFCWGDKIKEKEGIDTYDIGTNFNPLKF